MGDHEGAYHEVFHPLKIATHPPAKGCEDDGPMTNLEYLAVLGLCLVITLPLELVRHVGVYKQVRRLLASLGCVAAVFVSWDLIGARLGHWDYNSMYITGLRVIRLPIEEYLFFVVIPLCGILTFEAVCATLADVSGWLSVRREQFVEWLRR
jgi:lycopene beta-cyclase